MTIRVLILLLLSHTNIIVQVTVNSISYSAALYIPQGVSLLYGRHNEGETYSFTPVALRRPLLVPPFTSFRASSERSEGSVMIVFPCHPERSEGSVSLWVEMLRGVYTERSECA